MKCFYFLMALFFLTNLANAQNRIYFKDGSKIDGKVTQIYGDEIKYAVGTDPIKRQSAKVKASKVVLVFNSYGDFLYFTAAGDAFDHQEETNFLHETGITRNNDLIFTNTGDILTANILNDNLNEKTDTLLAAIKGQQVSFPTKTLVLVIRKNGSHVLFTDATTAIQYLTNKKDINQRLSEPPQPALVAAPPANPVVEATPTGNIVAVAVNTNAAPATSTTTTTDASPAPAVSATVSPKFDSVFFLKQGKEKIRDFEGYLRSIIDPTKKISESSKSVDLAKLLFVKDAHIETSSLARPDKVTYPIASYLSHLQHMASHYDRVNIEFADIEYATNFSQNVDGSWSAVVTVVQRYQAIADNKVMYEDETKKNITITVISYKKAGENGDTTVWELYLGNTSVTETAKI